MKKHLISTLAMLCLTTMNAATYDFEKILLYGNGDDKGKIIITIVGDGFKESQIGTINGTYTLGDATNDFLPRAVACKELLMKTSPFSLLGDQVKVYAINVHQESGSFFEVTKEGTTQYPSAAGQNKLSELIAQYAPTTALKVVLTKTQVGGDVARPAQRTVCLFYPAFMMHEVGHAMANLADEDTRTTNLFERPDLTATSDSTKVRWKSFIGINGITVKQKGTGAAASWYVPGVEDLMGGGRNFHNVNSAAIIESAADITGAPFYGTLYNGIATNGSFVSKPLNTETTIDFPSGWGFIYDYAFHGCDKLQTLTIPEDVTKIGQYAFLKCTGLKNITNEATTPQTINSTTFYGVTRSAITLTVPTGARTAYEAAGWTDFNIRAVGDPVDYFDVLFDSKGGSTVTKQIIASGGVVTEPSPAPARTGHTFAGWYKDATYQNQWNFATDRVTANITLYAKWTINTYTVTFNPKGGDSVASQSIPYGGKVTEPSAPTFLNYTFDGWFKEFSCINVWNFTTDTVTANITLHAKWTLPQPPPPSSIEDMVETDQKPSLHAWMSNGMIYITGLTIGEPYQVYTISGTLIYQAIATDS